MGRPDSEKAAMYAAYKMLERELEKDGDLPAGFRLDLSGQSVTVQFPIGTVVERDRGTNGDGSIYKSATTSLYGWHVIYFIAERLKKFNQWVAIKGTLIDALRHCLTNNKRVAQRLEEIDPAFADEVARLKQELAPPPRREATPRVCKDPGQPPQITVRTN
jgi:hypothetical protein